MKTAKRLSGEQWWFVTVLTIFGILAALSWFKESDHQPIGRSRIAWPPETRRP